MPVGRWRGRTRGIDHFFALGLAGALALVAPGFCEPTVGISTDHQRLNASPAHTHTPWRGTSSASWQLQPQQPTSAHSSSRSGEWWWWRRAPCHHVTDTQQTHTHIQTGARQNHAHTHTHITIYIPWQGIFWASWALRRRVRGRGQQPTSCSSPRGS